MDAAQDAVDGSANLGGLGENDMRAGVVVDRPQVFVVLKREPPAVEDDPVDRPLSQGFSESLRLAAAQVQCQAPQVARGGWHGRYGHGFLHR